MGEYNPLNPRRLIIKFVIMLLEFVGPRGFEPRTDGLRILCVPSINTIGILPVSSFQHAGNSIYAFRLVS